MADTYIKWNSSSADGKKLIAMFKKGMIATVAKPSEIKNSVPEFHKYKGNSFRSAFYRLRDQYSQDKPIGADVGLKGDKGKYKTVITELFFVVLNMPIIDVSFQTFIR